MRRSRFVRAFGLVSGATASGQIIALISVPLLSRIYDTTDFGEYGVFVAVGTALSALGCLRLDLAVPRADDKKASEEIAAAGIMCAGLFSLVLLSLAIALKGTIPGIELGHVGVLLLPVSVYVGAVWLVLNQLAIRRGQFRIVAARALIQPAVAFAFQGAWMLVSMPGPGLIIGYLAGQTVAAACYLADSRGSMASSLGTFWRTLLAHRSYIMVMTPQGVLNSVNVQLPLLMMSWLYSAQTTGFFSMTQRVMGVPIGLVGITMGQVYISFLAERRSESPATVTALFNRVSAALALGGLALILGTLLLAPPLFGFVLGPQWMPSARYAQLASVMYGAQLIAAPLATTLVVMRQEAVQAKWDTFRFIMLLGCLFFAWRFALAPSNFVVLITVGMAATYAALWVLCKRSIAAWTQRGAMVESSLAANANAAEG